MTLKQKREIVTRFKAGKSMWSLFVTVRMVASDNEVEAVIRDYMNGKFALKPERKRK